MITRPAESGSITIMLGVHVNCPTQRVGPGSGRALVSVGAGGAGKAGGAAWGRAAACTA